MHGDEFDEIAVQGCNEDWHEDLEDVTVIGGP